MFASGKFLVWGFRVVLFGRLFVCLLRAKGFLCIFPEPESGGLHSIGDVGPKPPVPQFVILYNSRQKQTNKPTAIKLREPPFSYFQNDREARDGQGGTMRSSLSVTMGLVVAEQISAFLSLTNPVYSRRLTSP